MCSKGLKKQQEKWLFGFMKSDWSFRLKLFTFSGCFFALTGGHLLHQSTLRDPDQKDAPTRLEAIASGLEAIAIGLEAIAITSIWRTTSASTYVTCFRWCWPLPINGTLFLFGGIFRHCYESKDGSCQPNSGLHLTILIASFCFSMKSAVPVRCHSSDCLFLPRVV